MSITLLHNPVELNRLVLEIKRWFPDDDWEGDRYWLDPGLGKTDIPVTDSPPMFCLDLGMALKHIVEPLQKTRAILSYTDYQDKEGPVFIVAFVYQDVVSHDFPSWRSMWPKLSEISIAVQTKYCAIAPTMPLAICLAYLKSEGVEFELAPGFEDELWRLVDTNR